MLQEVAVSPNPDVEQWLKANAGLIYTCPHLPGQPRITRRTCLRRQALANQLSKRFNEDWLNDVAGPLGLSCCLGCPVLKQSGREKAS